MLIRFLNSALNPALSIALLVTSLNTASAIAHQIEIAHNIEIDQDVAATLHIEPNDNPKAGEEALTWFALTRPGGRSIPLQQCDCKLAVYAEPRSAQAPPLLTPPLQPISAENYQNIPAAKIVFPRAGRYTLVLTGRPQSQAGAQSSAAFKPFDLRYEVTVATGTTTQTSPSTPPTIAASPPIAPSPAPATSQAPDHSWLVSVAIKLGLLAIVGFWLGGYLLRKP